MDEKSICILVLILSAIMIAFLLFVVADKKCKRLHLFNEKAKDKAGLIAFFASGHEKYFFSGLSAFRVC